MTYKISVRAVRTTTETTELADPRDALELASIAALSLLRDRHTVTITVRRIEPKPTQAHQPPTTHTAHLF